MSSPEQPPPTNTDKSTPPQPTLYLGYGSNLWLHQMHTRCPESHYLGIARLPNYHWIINDRGYANVVVEAPSSATSSSKDSATVYGLVYHLSPTDEARLDVNEGVPEAYTKDYLDCDVWWAKTGKSKIDTGRRADATAVKLLVYVDRKRVVPCWPPREEYVYRMNQGIADALRMGFPERYVTEVMRKFIPAEQADESNSLAQFAKGQAVQFKDESGIVR